MSRFVPLFGAVSLGGLSAACAPMVRSSYWADEQAHSAGVVRFWVRERLASKLSAMMELDLTSQRLTPGGGCRDIWHC